jgi:hypothetical protein
LFFFFFLQCWFPIFCVTCKRLETQTSFLHMCCIFGFFILMTTIEQVKEFFLSKFLY